MCVAGEFDDGRELAAIHGKQQRKATFERTHAPASRFAPALRHRPGLGRLIIVHSADSQSRLLAAAACRL
jgi:hypothetical protein